VLISRSWVNWNWKVVTFRCDQNREVETRHRSMGSVAHNFFFWWQPHLTSLPNLGSSHLRDALYHIRIHRALKLQTGFRLLASLWISLFSRFEDYSLSNRACGFMTTVFSLTSFPLPTVSEIVLFDLRLS
jgi:hypothetical protein